MSIRSVGQSIGAVSRAAKFRYKPAVAMHVQLPYTSSLAVEVYTLAVCTTTVHVGVSLGYVSNVSSSLAVEFYKLAVCTTPVHEALPLGDTSLVPPSLAVEFYNLAVCTTPVHERSCWGIHPSFLLRWQSKCRCLLHVRLPCIQVPFWNPSLSCSNSRPLPRCQPVVFSWTSSSSSSHALLTTWWWWWWWWWWWYYQRSRTMLYVRVRRKVEDRQDLQGLISADRNSKATLPLTIPRPIRVVCRRSSPRNCPVG